MIDAQYIGSNILRSATLSPCGRYRYWLTRYWASIDTVRPLMFIMLNPSTADADKDDPTIRKCVGFAQRMGFTGIDVVNLFAYRATAPADLKRAGWPQGPENLATVLQVAEHVRKRNGAIVLAWGAHARGRPEVASYAAALIGAGHDLHVLQRTPDGTPRHPLMLPYTCTLQRLPA